MKLKDLRRELNKLAREGVDPETPIIMAPVVAGAHTKTVTQVAFSQQVKRARGAKSVTFGEVYLMVGE